MAAVDLGDGNSMELGENPSPELLARVKTVIEANKAKASPGAGIWEQAKSFGADFLRGAGRSLAGLAEGAAAFNSTERPSFKKSETGQTVVGPSGDTPPVLTEAVNKALPAPPGAGTARQYVRAGLEGLGGGVATGGVSPTVMVSGLVGGLGGEAGQRLAGEPGKLLGTIAGGVIGGGAVAAANMVRPQTAAVAKEAMEGFTEAELRQAQAFKNKMTSAGTEIDLAQALRAVTGREGNLTSIRNSLANRSQGNEVQRILNQQPAALQREGDMTVAGLPGRNITDITPVQVANNVKETATDAVNAAKRARTKLWEDTVLDGAAELRAKDAANIAASQAFTQRTGMPVTPKLQAGTVVEIPPQVLAQADGFLKKAIAGQPPGSVEAAELSGLYKALQGRDGPLTDPKQINQILTQFTTRLKSPDLQTLGMDAGKVKYLGGVVNQIRDELGTGFEPIRKANAAYRNYTNDVVNPLRQGPVGMLAGPHGYDPATSALVSKFDGLMKVGTLPNAKVSDIRTTVKELGKLDPTAAEDAFKNWVARSIGKSMDTPTAAGQPATNADMANRVYKELFKDSARWQGIKDATAEMAKLRGQKPEEVIRGLENYRQLLNAAISRPSVMEGLSAADVKQLGGASNLANAVRVFSFLPANRLGEAIERSTLGKTFSEFDTILTSREGADRLIKLGKVPIVSTGAKIMFGTLGAGLGNPSGLSQNNPPE